MTGRLTTGRGSSPIGAIVLLLSLLVLGATLPTAAPSAAQGESTADARFGELSAIATFPTAIVFDLAVEAPEEIVRAELLFAPRWTETLNLIEAEIEPERRVEVEFPLDMYQNYVPPGLDLLYRWRVTDASGRESVSEEQVVLWEDSRFDWREYATDEVSVFSYTGNDAFNAQILESAQRTVDELQDEFGLERSLPIRIWNYNSREDFGGAQQPNSEPWMVGAAYMGMFLILSVVPDGNEYELGRIVPHEVAHQIVFQAALNPFNLPARWLNEGIAVYHQDSDKDGYGEVVRAAVAEGRLIPLAALHREFPFDDSHSVAYAESLNIVEFVIAEWGAGALGEVLAAYRDGVSHDEALRRGLGLTIAELEQRWHEALGYEGHRSADDGTGGPIDSTATAFWTTAGRADREALR